MTCCTKCQGLLRFDLDEGVRSWCCMNCGRRTYEQFQPHVVRVEQRGQAKFCKGCGMGTELQKDNRCSRCLQGRIQQGLSNTARAARLRALKGVYVALR